MEVGARKDLLNKTYPAKLLLFGEHLVLEGAASLAVPLDHFGAKWTKGKSAEPMGDFYSFLSSLSFINKRLLDELKESRLYLKSDIPRGYGLGSSGALCAAVYDYIVDTIASKSPSQIINELAKVESFFHGKSSGLDAYVCLKKEAVMMKEGVPHQSAVDIQSLPFNIYLLDSGHSRSSKDLIGKFVSNGGRSNLRNELIKTNDAIINAISTGNYYDVMAQLNALSRYQFDVLNYMIVDAIKPFWKEGLQSDDFSIKLCGAGGGGFYLGFGYEGCFDHFGGEVIQL